MGEDMVIKQVLGATRAHSHWELEETVENMPHTYPTYGKKLGSLYTSSHQKLVVSCSSRVTTCNLNTCMTTESHKGQ